jgi:hypothetical protein
VFIGFLGLRRAEEADHALSVKAIRLAPEGALISFGFFCPLSGQIANTTAYSYIAAQATVIVNGQTSVIDSATTLATIAQASDQQSGVITAYTPTDGSFEQGKPIVDMTMRVTRSGGSYDVHIQIGLSNGKWRVLHMDSL